MKSFECFAENVGIFNVSSNDDISSWLSFGFYFNPSKISWRWYVCVFIVFFQNNVQVFFFFLCGNVKQLIVSFQVLEVEPLYGNELFNIYYSIDACGARLEPLLNSQLAMLPPVNLPRYSDITDAAENNDR